MPIAPAPATESKESPKCHAWARGRAKAPLQCTNRATKGREFPKTPRTQLRRVKPASHATTIRILDKRIQRNDEHVRTTQATANRHQLGTPIAPSTATESKKPPKYHTWARGRTMAPLRCTNRATEDENAAGLTNSASQGQTRQWQCLKRASGCWRAPPTSHNWATKIQLLATLHWLSQATCARLNSAAVTKYDQEQ